MSEKSVDMLPMHCKHKNGEKDWDTLIEQSVTPIDQSSLKSTILIEQSLITTCHILLGIFEHNKSIKKNF